MSETPPSDFPPKIPIFRSKKFEGFSGRKSFKKLILVLGPLLLGGILLSWALGRLVFHQTDPEEVLPVVFQGPGQARRAAIGEWAFQLRSLDLSQEKNKNSAWIPRSNTVKRLLRLLAEARPENDSLYKSSIAIVLGYASTDTAEVNTALEKALSEESGLDAQFSIQALLSLARLQPKTPADPELLSRLQAHPDAGLRKALAFSLGSGLWKEDGAVRSTLYALLRDPVEDVRWNAAFALAAKGDPEGLSVIEELVVRAEKMNVANPEPLTAELLEAFTEAFRWAEKLNNPRLIQMIQGFATSHPNLKIRQAAIQALSKN